MKIALALALGFVAGFCLHMAFGTPSASAVAFQAASAALTLQAGKPAGTCTIDWDRLRREVASVAREPGASAQTEDAASDAEAGSAGAAAPPPEEAPRASSDSHDEKQAQARQAKDTLLSQALQAGEWTEADAVKARRLMSVLSSEDRQGLLSGIAVAVNSGRLKLQTIHPF